MKRTAAAIVASCVLGFGCRDAAVVPEDVSDPASLRADVLAAVPPLAGRSEYAVDDPDLVDPCIASAQRQTRARREDIVRSAAICVKSALATPDGVARLAKKIEARYAAPVITRNGDTVTIDVGIVPGPLNQLRGETLVGDGPFHDRGQWRTSEIVKALVAAHAAHPDAQKVVATALLLQRWARPDWTYIYDRQDDRIRVTTPAQPPMTYVSETIGGDLSKVTSLHTLGLSANRL